MANTYASTPVLSKVKIGNEIYFLKDADVRAIIDAYGTAVGYDVATTLNADNAELVTSKAIAEYIEKEISGLAGAMHFEGVKEALPATVEGYESGDVIIVGNKEYVCDGSNWVELGDESIYLTTATAEATYVKKTLTIAGIDLQDDITVAELQAALALKALAYKDSASVTLTDYATGINAASYTPAGSVAVTLNHASTAMASTGSFTPAGTVAGTTTATGTVAIARDDANGVQISGTVAAPTITVTPNTAEVQHIANVGSLPTYTAAQYTAPSVNEASAQFASQGLVAALDGTDTEMLVFSDAAKASALTATNFNAGSYTAAEFNAGSLPTLGATQTVVVGIASATSTAPVFTGDKFGATFSGTEAAIAASFTGTEGNVSVSGNYDKAGVESAAFTGTAAEIAPTLAVGSKTITVQ